MVRPHNAGSGLVKPDRHLPKALTTTSLARKTASEEARKVNGDQPSMSDFLNDNDLPMPLLHNAVQEILEIYRADSRIQPARWEDGYMVLGLRHVQQPGTLPKYTWWGIVDLYDTPEEDLYTELFRHYLAAVRAVGKHNVDCLTMSHMRVLIERSSPVLFAG